eukprot:CAMPEP_0173093122 /NCGR_PEP_ID=MMETSP1102-20130122/29723_2 /TAXON_ID=49646 /ORGANISM="Geminigera sp., Strain Caron Lab Isolate" /LENGTH=164 /DNA_ID=CAMNT_0013980919 /DNA_START=589 /DNA_END=1079 /DNA_ORIENTATION=-
MRHCRHKSQPSTRWPLASCRTHAHSAAPRSSTWRPPFHTSAAAGRVEDDGLTWSDRADDVHSHVPPAPTFVSVLFAEAIGDTRPLLDERQLLSLDVKGPHRTLASSRYGRLEVGAHVCLAEGVVIHRAHEVAKRLARAVERLVQPRQHLPSPPNSSCQSPEVLS